MYNVHHYARVPTPRPQHRKGKKEKKKTKKGAVPEHKKSFI